MWASRRESTMSAGGEPALTYCPFMKLIGELRQSVEADVALWRKDEADWLGKALEEELAKQRSVVRDVVLPKKRSHLAQ
ncbi:hypothetical protein HPB50_029478 [Hyalomma asiaticum]|nr:hypothetical protein HPB50_029478 [Hyalomma asiaticum]